MDATRNQRNSGRHSGWAAWIGGAAAIVAVAGGLYGAERYLQSAPLTERAIIGMSQRAFEINPGRSAAQTAMPAESVSVTEVTAIAAAEVPEEETFVYFFSNNKATVTDSRTLESIAETAASTGADVTVTGYASETGSTAYNKAISEERAENIAEYLEDHGVDTDHIKVVSGGATDRFGDAAHNRRADITVEY